MEELHQNVDLLYKLSPFIFAISAQFIAFVLLRQKFNDHLEEYKLYKDAHKEEKKLLWDKFDKLKESIDHLNNSMTELTTILKFKNHHNEGLDK